MSSDLSGFSLFDLFRTEAESQVALLTDGLLALESAGSAPEVVEPLMRAAHSLKGAARIVRMTAAEQLAHALEDVFVAAQHGRIALAPGDIDTLLDVVDLLGASSRIDEKSAESWTAEHGSQIRERLAALKAIEQGASQAPAAPSKPASEPTADTKKRPRTPKKPRAARSPRNPKAATEPPPALASAPAQATPPPVAAVSMEIAPGASDGAGAPESVDRVVRVSSDSLNRLMGLAGESLVQARQLRPLVDALSAVRQAHARLAAKLNKLEETLASIPNRQGTTALEELLQARHAASHCVELLDQRRDRIEDHARHGEDLAERLHQEVISSRLRPLIDGARGFPRLVRDTARELGKRVRFEIIGENTGVDRDILEKLESPLNHLIRNALDHAVETPEERAAAGKDQTATIRLEARHVAGMLQIRLSDDGRGIDPERIRHKILERGLASAEMVEKMTVPEVLEFLFLPGFSTKAEVTAISGRGVGLDVVRRMAQEVGGSARVHSQVGAGTSFTLHLPITMSVIRALLVRIAGQPYAFPLSRLESIERIHASDVETIEGRPFFTLDGHSVGLVSAEEVLELPATSRTDDVIHVVVVSDGGRTLGVVVQEFLGELDLDVRPLDPRLGKVANLNSASVLEDGWPVLIFDVEDLVRTVDNLLHGRRFKLSPAAQRAAAEARRAKRVLVVDDSLTVRELERQLLAAHGYEVDIAVDGMDGWNAVRSVHYDLVVSDVDMPRLDGFALVELIKRHPSTQTLPIVIVSYKDREEDRLRGLDAGADAYLTKSSFHDQTFLQTVADLIGD